MPWINSAEWVGAYGQWANTFATLVTAGVVAYLTWRMYKDANTKNKIELIAQQVNLINHWNSLLLSNDENMRAFEKMGPVVRSVRDDNIIFTYLNYGRIVWEMDRLKLFESPETELQLNNVVTVFSKVATEEFAQILNRGYPPDYRERLMDIRRAMDAKKADAAKVE